MKNPSLLRDTQVAERLNVSRATIWNWLAKKGLPEPVRLHGITRWRSEDIDAFINTSAT